MKEQLTLEPVESRPQPENYYDRTGLQLDPEKSEVFNQLQKTEIYAEENNCEN